MSTPGGSRDGQQMVAGHERMRRMILTGELPPGAELSQTELGEILELGRTPLREVLRLLHEEGLVIATPNRRVRIAELSAADVEDLYVVRLSLELVAIRETVASRTEPDIAAMEGLLTQIDYYASVGDVAEADHPHAEFHARLVAGAGPRARATIARLADHASRYRYANVVLAPDSWEQRRAEHRAVLDAVKARDADAAVTALAGHYLASVGHVMAGVDPSYDPEGLRIAVAALAPDAVDLVPRADRTSVEGVTT
ncbi:MAG: GntR family transcriptional regulator [Solirubrobacteraceae bacterium]|nr:GntR family transcriptional regulator [Solirubrobacteraceae bacterium]